MMSGFWFAMGVMLAIIAARLALGLVVFMVSGEDTLIRGLVISTVASAAVYACLWLVRAHG